jgi:chaperonin GroES
MESANREAPPDAPCAQLALSRLLGLTIQIWINWEIERMKIRPLHDRVVVRRLEEETTTAGGIVLPDSATEKPSQGEILAAGPGKLLDNGDVRSLDVEVGDKIIFGQYAGSTVKIDNEELLILSESEIFGVLEG